MIPMSVKKSDARHVIYEPIRGPAQDSRLISDVVEPFKLNLNPLRQLQAASTCGGISNFEIQSRCMP